MRNVRYIVVQKCTYMGIYYNKYFIAMIMESVNTKLWMDIKPRAIV